MFLPSGLYVCHDSGSIFVFHLHVVAAGMGLELAGATVVGDPEAVAALVEVDGRVPLQRDPVVVSSQPLREGALVVAAVH